MMNHIFATSSTLRATCRLCLDRDESPERAFALFLPSWGIVHHREIDLLGSQHEKCLPDGVDLTYGVTGILEDEAQREP